jgi:hypothetical protein
MKRAPRTLFIVLAVLCFVGLLKATLPQVGIGKWTSTSNLAQARSNSASVLLADGRILIIGGENSNGPLASAEIFGSDGIISSAGLMNGARSQHFAVMLSDSRVLVGGGTTTGGGTTNSAEIYDPAANSWTQINPLTTPRANATAALLQDGRVLIAGGDNAGVPSNTIEIYDPSTGNFSFAATLSTPRTQHAMAVLQDGHVLIAGGFDGTNPLGSTEIFDPTSDTVSAGPLLATARYAASATTLLNGQVAVIGGAGSDGSGGTTDLASIEVFDPAGTFTATSASLTTAREGHQAFLLPNNNNVLIVGGTSGATALSSSELFTVQASPSNGAWSYTVSSTGAVNSARAGATGSANQLSGPSSVVAFKPGYFLVVGGKDATGATLASTEIYGYSTIQTDRGDYPPGTTVNITGSGFEPNETVAITLIESPLIDTHGPYTVTADANGNISNSSFTTDTHDENVRFWLSAVGSQSGLLAQNTFTDSAAATVEFATVGLPSGQSVTVTYSGTNNGGNPVSGSSIFTSPGPSTGNNIASTSPGTSFTYSFPTSITVNGTTYNFSSGSPSRPFNTGASGSTTTVTGTYAPACTLPSVTIQPLSQSITYGQNATFTAGASGNPSPTVQWQVSTNGGSTWTNVAGATSPTLTLTAPPASASGNQYRAVFTNTCNGTQTATTNAATLTVNKMTVTATVTANNRAYDGTTTAIQNTCTLIGLQPGDTGNVTCSASALAFVDKNVGSGKTVDISGITLSGSAAGNYTLSSTNATTTANITARAITVTAAANAKTYDGTTSASATPSITTGSLATGDTANFTEAYATKNVGTNLALTPSGTVNDGNRGNNYRVTFANGNNGIITARPITVTAATNSKQYEGTTSTTATPTITSGSLATGDTANFSEAYTTKNVGTGLTLVPTGTVSDGNSGHNYAVTFANNTTGVITALAITVTAATDTKVYDGTTSSTGIPTVTTGSLVAGDTASFTQSFDSKNAGTRTLTPTGSVTDSNGGNNYSLSFKTATGSITAKPLTVTASGANKQYDGTTAATVTLTDNRLSGDSFTDSYSSAVFASKNAGTGKTITVSGILISGTDVGNYSLSSTTTTATADITARVLIVTATGVNKQYDGTTAAVVTLEDNRISGDAIADSYTSSTFADANAGSGKTINVTGISISGTEAGNYSLQNTAASATADITPAVLTLMVTAASGTYTSIPFTASCVASGVVAGDNSVSTIVTYSSGGTPILAAVVAGNYLATCNINPNPNYQATAATAPFMISPATLTATAHNQSMTFGGSAPNFTAQVTGFQGSEDSGIVSGLTFTILDSNQTPVTDLTTLKVGSYSIAPSGAAAPNYIFQFVNGTLTVNKATFTGTVVTTADDPKNVAYGQPLTATVNLNSYSIGGVNILQPHQDPNDPNRQLLESLTVYLIPAGGNASQAVKFGTASAVPTYDNTTNTSGTTKTGWTATITGNAPVPGNYNVFVYGDDPGDNSLVNGNLVDVGYFYPDTADITYPILQSKPIDVVQAKVTGSFTVNDKVYDATTAATIASRSLAGSIGHDDVSLSGGTVTFSDKNAGNGKTVTGTGFTLSGNDAAKYQLDSSTLTTTANITPLTISGIFTAGSKTYDATTEATITGRSLNGVLGSDAVQLYGGTAAFSDKNVGTGKTVTGTGFSLSGGDAGNYKLASTSLTTTADISALHITGRFNADNKVYDGTTAAKVLTESVSPIAGDTLSLTGGTATFSDKNVGTGKTVTLTGATLGGTDAGNYVLDSVSTTTANITPKPLTVSATGVDKVYDGTTAATVTLSDDRVPGDVFTDSYTSATFANKNVGTAKPVSVTGVSISGTDAGNYTFSTTASTTADITQKPLTVAATAVSKQYDGTATASVTLADDRVSGDVVTDAYASATFNNKNVGSGKPVSVNGISIIGADAGNYLLQSTIANTSADITPRPLSITATGVNRVYDGTLAAAVMLGDDRIGGDVFTDSYASANFADKNVGTGKPVTVTGVSVSGPDAGNYTFNATAPASANITTRPITVTAVIDTKTYDGNTSSSKTPTITYGSIAAGDTPNFTQAFDSRNAGGRTLSPSGSVNDGNGGNDYVVTLKTTAGTISPLPVTVTAVTDTKTYDGTITSVGVPTIVPSLVSPDTATFAQSFDSKNAGPRTLTPSGSVGDGNGGHNYTLTFQTTAGSITPRPVTVAAESKTKVYGDVDPALTYEITSGSAVVPGDSFSGALARVPGENVGAYAMQSGTLTLGSNYALTFVGNNLTITAAPLTITPDGNKTKVLGSVFTAFTGVVSGLKFNDTVAVTYTSAGAPAAAAVRSYDVSVASYNFTTGAASNYSITTKVASLGLKVVYSTAACLGDLGHTILQPVNYDGSSVFQQKSTVPAKFRVCDANGNSIGAAGVVTNFKLVQTMAGTVVNTIEEVVVSTTPDTAFRWDPTGLQWIFNMNTKSLAANTTYYYTITLNDGSTMSFMFGLK